MKIDLWYWAFVVAAVVAVTITLIWVVMPPIVYVLHAEHPSSDGYWIVESKYKLYNSDGNYSYNVQLLYAGNYHYAFGVFEFDFPLSFTLHDHRKQIALLFEKWDKLCVGDRIPLNSTYSVLGKNICW